MQPNAEPSSKPSEAHGSASEPQQHRREASATLQPSAKRKRPNAAPPTSAASFKANEVTEHASMRSMHVDQRAAVDPRIGIAVPIVPSMISADYARLPERRTIAAQPPLRVHPHLRRQHGVLLPGELSAFPSFAELSARMEAWSELAWAAWTDADAYPRQAEVAEHHASMCDTPLANMH